MRKKSLIFATVFGAIGIVACDEGDIYETDGKVQTTGKTVLLTATVTGMDSWSSKYSVVLAGFNAEGVNIVQKPLPEGTEKAVRTTLELTSDDVARIELCVTNRLRERVVTFAGMDVTDVQDDTIRLDAGNVNLGMYQCIQDLVFTSTCARCHGLGNKPAGDLTLVEGQSYAQLVNHVSRVPANGIRVVPGNISASLLHKVIHGDAGEGVRFDHSNMIKEATTIALIDNWITDGAKP